MTATHPIRGGAAGNSISQWWTLMVANLLNHRLLSRSSSTAANVGNVSENDLTTMQIAYQRDAEIQRQTTVFWPSGVSSAPQDCG